MKRFDIWFPWMMGVLLVCMASAVPALAQPGKGLPADIAIDTAQGVHLKGQVLDPEGGPVPELGIRVQADGKRYGNGGKTDESGQFDIQVVPALSYELFVDSQGASQQGLVGGFFMDADGGFGADPGPDGQWSGATEPGWEDRTLFAVGEKGLDGLVIQLGRGSRIAGQVLYGSGEPVPDIRIHANGPEPGAWGSGCTDETGHYALFVAPGAQYRLSAWPGGQPIGGGFWRAGADSPLTEDGQDGILSPDASSASRIDASSDLTIHIIVPEPSYISGRIIDPHGVPISDIRVEAVSGDRGPYPLPEPLPVLDGAELPPERPETAPDEAPVQDRQREPAKATASPASDENRRPSPPADSEAIPPEADILPAPFIGPVYGAETDADGNYRIAVPSKAQYRVRVMRFGPTYYPGVDQWEDATVLDTTDGSLENIDFSVDRGLSIAGTLHGLQAEDTAFIDVFSRKARSRGHTSLTGTGQELAFQVHGLAQGADYRIRVHAKGYLSGAVQPDGSLGPAESAAGFAAGASDIAIEMRTGNTIAGTVYGLDEGEFARIEAWSESAKSGAGTEVQGTGEPVPYTLSGLYPAEDFQVRFHPQHHAPDCKTGVDSSQNPTAIDFTASEGASLSGAINGAGPHTRVWINVWSRSGLGGGFADVIADENGHADYAIAGLGKAGDYLVSASNDNLHLFYDGRMRWKEADLVDMGQGDVSGIDFDFSAIERYTLAGTLAGLSHESAQVWINAWDKQIGSWGDAEVTGNAAFSINLPRGSYRIELHSPMIGRPLFYDAESGELVSRWNAAAPLTLDADTHLGVLSLSGEWEKPFPPPGPMPLIEDEANKGRPAETEKS